MDQMAGIGEMSLGVIGGPETFAGQSTCMLRELHPTLAAATYFASGSALFTALRSGEVDAAVGASAILGDGYTIMPRMIAERDSGLYVVIEETLPFYCSLLGRKGSKLGDIRLIHGGPGSISLGRAFIKTYMPQASTAIYDEPFSTAHTIAQGDGKEAILGTRRFAQKFSLEILADNIDGGAVNGSWWVISRLPSFETNPTLVFVAGRFADDGKIGRLVKAVGAKGYELSSVSVYASGERLLEFDYLLRFRGVGQLMLVQTALVGFPSARLAGAIAPRKSSV
jgi:prephenate dehydratase